MPHFEVKIAGVRKAVKTSQGLTDADECNGLARARRAVHLLKTTSASVDEIAVSVGYTGGSILLVLLRRRLGIGIKEIRRSKS